MNAAQPMPFIASKHTLAYPGHQELAGKAVLRVDPVSQEKDEVINVKVRILGNYVLRKMKSLNVF